jgi:phage anti-repressor protein
MMELNMINISQDRVFNLIKSNEDFPVNLDDAWQWLGYARKDNAKATLLNNFIENMDFFRSNRKTPQGGRPSELILLTIECFKSLAMMSGTDKGREVRRYFLECEKLAKQSFQKHPYQRVWYQRLALFEQTTRIPVGYFCIFAEIAPLMRDLEANSILLRDNATIDASVGLCWNQWLRANNLFENFPLYPHTFPDNRGTINAKIYPDRLLPEFRSWLRMSYLNGNFPNYIKKQCSEDECLTIAKALGLEKQLLSA